MKRNWKRFCIGVLLIASILSLLAWATLTWVLVRPPSYEPKNLQTIELLGWPEHDAIYEATRFPYVLSIENNKGALEYVGATHTSDAENHQLKEIEKRWDEFKPTVAFCEGRKRIFRYASRPATGSLSESDLVRMLAYQNGVTLFTLEPTYEKEVAGLLKRFEPRMIATFMTLRVYSAESSGVDASDRDQLALQLLRKRTNVEGLKQTFADLEDFDQHWNEKFPEAPDWRTLSNPDQLVQLREIGDVSREIRGQHRVSSITELVQQGERVFAVVGASHVIRQEHELKRLLEN